EHFSLDHLGTPRLITDGSKVKLGLHTYMPFGDELLTATNTDTEAMKFTGHERDSDPTSDSGNPLDYMHARFYNPGVGRFLSVDPRDLANQLSDTGAATARFQRKLDAPQNWNR